MAGRDPGRERRSRHRLPLLALFVALGGTAYAATGFPANVIGAPQLKKSAVTIPKLKNNAVTGAKVANNSLTGADLLESTLGQVPSATRAERVTTATGAGSASSASLAGRADTVATAANATNATNVSSANDATSATTATTATNAANAGNTDQLAGSLASAYQRRVTGSCPDGAGSVSGEGVLACSEATASFAVALAPTFPAPLVDVPIQGLPFLDLDLAVTCDSTTDNEGHDTRIFLSTENNATLSWFYSVGTTVFAGSAVQVGGDDPRPVRFKNTRIEGRFIYAQGTDIATIKLHAVDGGTFCEVQGTIVYASSA